MSTRPRTPAPGTPAPGKLPITELDALVERGQPIVMITAYDAPSGRLADEAGADLVLVGDSAAMTVLGHESTVLATMEEMLVLTRAVTRGARRPLMIADLHLELELAVVPTVRDPDGLALSSRNARLSDEERARALALPRALATLDPETARTILEDAGLDVEYVVLAPFAPPVLAAAVHVGTTRLIDNVPLEEDR